MKLQPEVRQPRGLPRASDSDRFPPPDARGRPRGYLSLGLITFAVLLRAQVVAPIVAPAIRDGGVIVRGGRIVAVGPAAALARRADAGGHVDLGRTVLTPGLVNAHTHLELSRAAAPAARPASFADWIHDVASRRSDVPPDDWVPAAVAAGVAESLRCGVTCVGDISKYAALSRPVLAASPIRAVSFGEALGMGGAAERFRQGLETAADTAHATGRLAIGVSPHAPYTVNAEGYRAALALADERRLPIATHLAESPEEAQFVRTAGGPFADVWRKLGGWRDGMSVPFDGSPVALAEHVGLLAVPAVLAHVNHVDDADLARLTVGRASVVWCPRTHRLFGNPPHRWRDMLTRGVNVAVGTDSRATAPDLNLLAELRAVGGEAETLTLWRMATTNAARALGHADLGGLAPGWHADLAAWPIDGAGDPLRALIGEPRPAAALWVGGEFVQLPQRAMS